MALYISKSIATVFTPALRVKYTHMYKNLSTRMVPNLVRGQMTIWGEGRHGKIKI